MTLTINNQIMVNRIDSISIRASLNISTVYTHGIQLGGKPIDTTLQAKQKLFNELAAAILSEIDVPSEHDELDFCDVTCNDMKDGVIMANPETMAKLKYFIKESHELRLYGVAQNDEVI